MFRSSRTQDFFNVGSTFLFMSQQFFFNFFNKKGGSNNGFSFNGPT